MSTEAKKVYLGYEKGEVCNRNGCKGILDEHDREGSCRCHIHPPCSYCVDTEEFCPQCGWEATEERSKPAPVDPKVQRRNQEAYARQQRAWEEAEAAFNRKFDGREEITKLEIRSYAHTHFSMRQKGVFPKKSETQATLLPKLQGTFGGRFTRFTDTTFEYIAYTD